MSLENYQQASFRGIPFLIGSLDTEGGRKDITHEYPNSDRRLNEDLGLLNKTFTIRGLVKTLDDFTSRDRLIEALERGGAGELVHPTFGAITVAAKPYTVSENTTEIGIARFSMVFERTQSPIFPAQTSVKTSLIKSETDTAIDGVTTDLTDTFKVTSTSNYNAGLAKLNEIGAKFADIGSTVTAVTSNINSFTATVSSFVDNATANIFAPALLADSIKDMFLEFDTLAPDIKDQFNLASQFFQFGSNDATIPTTTVARQEKADNQLILNTGIRGEALALAINNAANISYGNENELEEIRVAIEDEYQDLIENTNLSNDTIDALTQARNSLRILFDNLSITVPMVSTVSTNTIPMSILSYQYYGSTDNTEDLIALNSAIDVSFIEGEVQILT